MSPVQDAAAMARRAATRVIVLFGLVSLFGDIVYEGARSVNGPYLQTLGANAAVVGMIAGIGEFVGYGVRLLSGVFADRLRAYWLLTFLGYGALISVPLLALAGVWQVAAVFIVVERFGKALRAPAKDTLISHAARHVGTGFGFGMHEAMDQIGAIAGPLIFAGVLWAAGNRGTGSTVDYQAGYRMLWIPFVLVMTCIVAAYLRSRSVLGDAASGEPTPSDRLSATFWWYVAFTAVTTMGFLNVVLLSFHFKQRAVLSDALIPLLYAAAMGVDGLAAMGVGLWYDHLKRRTSNDRAGLTTLAVIPVLSVAVPVLGFSAHRHVAAAAVLLWGVVMGMHETVMRSAIADLTPVRKRGTGYGIFNVVYGLAIAAGSAICGVLYDRSPGAAVVFCIVLQGCALPLFLVLRRAALQVQPERARP